MTKRVQPTLRGVLACASDADGGAPVCGLHGVALGLALVDWKPFSAALSPVNGR